MRGHRKSSVIVGSWISGGPEVDDYDVDGIRLGLSAARGLAKDHGWRTVWLVTNTADDLQRNTIVRALGQATVRDLRAQRDASTGSYAFRHATGDTIGRRGVGEVVLALYPQPRVLDRLDDLMRPNAVVVVPDQDPTVQAWVDAWGPYDIVTKTDRPRLEITDPEVLAEVEHIMARITGLGHPDDEQMIRQVFRRLRRRRRNVDARAIRAYVVRETLWGTAQADILAKIAAGRSDRRS